MHRALTWQQVVAILAGIAAFMFGIFAFGQGRDLDPMRPAMRIWFGISALILVACLIWHFRRTGRKDLLPDLLAQRVPAATILELGRCHLHLTSATRGKVLYIQGLVQNLNDGPGRLELRFIDRTSVRSQRATVPDLICDVPGAAVVAFDGRFPSGGAVGQTHKVFIEGRFRGSGRQVRFARRRALSKRVSPMMTIFALFAGTLYTGGGTFLTFTIQDGSGPPARGPVNGQWNTTPVWLPGQQSVAR